MKTLLKKINTCIHKPFLCLFLFLFQEFSAHLASSTSNSQLLGKVSSSMKSASMSLRLKNPDPSFVPHGKYFQDLSETFGLLDRIETRLQSERAGGLHRRKDM